MERGRADIRKNIASCRGNIFCIAIYIGQAATIPEGRATDARHTVANGDWGQTSASVEGIVADAGHAVWDGDRGQTTAARKGIAADAGHAVWDGDRGRPIHPEKAE